jgi:hypothetical protein
MFKRHKRRERALFFLHIPKTAGTSFTQIIEPLYASKEKCNAYYNQDLMAIEPATLSRFRLFIGHIDYATSDLMPNDLDIITFLRDPIERAISSYEHIKTRKDHPQYKLLHAEAANLYDFVRHPVFCSQLKESQTGMLGRDNAFKVLYDLAHTGNIKLEEAKYLSNEHRKRQVTKLELLVAQYRLRNMAFFGIQEWFHESVVMFCDEFKVPLPAQLPWENESMLRKSGRRREYSEEDIDAISEMCPFDIQLYNFAKRLFRERYERKLKDAQADTEL